MLDWFQSVDNNLLQFVRVALRNPFFDWLMPIPAAGGWLAGLGVPLAVGLIWKGGRRGCLCLLMMAWVLVLGDALICHSLKHAIHRPRPPNHNEQNVTNGSSRKDASMPSAHAANAFALVTVAVLFYRRRAAWLYLVAAGVAFSRVYLGKHYPTDVLVGAVLGTVYAVGLVWLLDTLWRVIGKRWFTPWWGRCPSLRDPDAPTVEVVADEVETRHLWLRLGYLSIAVLLLVRMVVIASGRLELCEDEAYQWMWSKHLALSYYSKPPMIAYTQWLGTHLWGDTAFGVRFFSPVIAAVLGLVWLRFLAREVDARLGFWLVWITASTPLLALGAMLMTIDALSVLFWSLATLAGWRAVRDDSTAAWCWCGLWMGLGFLSKYTALFQWLCWVVVFLTIPETRRQLKRPGPYLALAINAVCTLPVLVWNWQHDWITVTHLGERGGLNKAWELTQKYIIDFLGSEFGLLNPVFFVALVWAGIVIWRNRRGSPLVRYLFGMGAPLFLFYLAFTIRSRVLANWIAPAILPLFAMMGVYWFGRWRDGSRAVLHWLWVGGVLGAVAVLCMHEYHMLYKITGVQVPLEKHPISRVSGSRELAALVDKVRLNLEKEEGTETFIIGGHYGLTSLITFYLPKAREGVPDHRFVFCLSSAHPENQYYFWRGYKDRVGQNAIYVIRVRDGRQPVPPQLRRQFESVTNLGVYRVWSSGQVAHRVQLFACRNLRGQARPSAHD
jgi:membrane-associated phospholipid phosphatase